jgi:hypothetical protein
VAVNKILLSLVVFASLLFAPEARALEAGVPFGAFVDGAFVATLVFEPDAWLEVGACRYIATVDPGEGVPAQMCVLDEATRFGFFSCPENALGPFVSIVVVTPGQFCDLYDAGGQDNQVFVMLLGESADGSLDGIIQFSAAASIPSPFHAEPLTPG